MEDYIVFRKISTRDCVSELSSILVQNGIAFFREDTFVPIDSSSPDKGLKTEYLIRLKKENCDFVEKLLRSATECETDSPV